MTEPSAKHETLRELIAALRDGQLTDEQADRLNAELANEPSAREVFARYALLQAMLELEMGTARPPVAATTTVLRTAPVSPGLTFFGSTMYGVAGQLSHGWPLAYLIAMVTCGLGLLIGSMIYVSSPAEFATNSDQRPQTPAAGFVGRITGMVDCKWADSSTGAFNGADVPLGRKYALASGLMEITYRSGATVILQGPATYEVESAAGGFLSLGKLTARVEKKEERRTKNEELPDTRSSFLIPHSYFVVRTPTATVTDLGTEFGVEAGESGDTSTSVFRGVVEVQPLSKDGQRGQAVRLTENESAYVGKSSDGSLSVQHGTTSSSAFVRAEQFSKLAEQQRVTAFRRWQAFSQELRRDRSLVAYYDFQQKNGVATVLPNVAESGNGDLDGAVENAGWTNGRVPGKHALLFYDPTVYVRINLPQKTADVTLAAWVCFDTFDVPSASALLMSDGWETPGKLCWQVGADGRMCFSSTSAVSGSGNAFSSTSLGNEQLHRWIHLACVYDHAAKRVRFYVDGSDAGDIEYDTDAPLVIGPAQIGNWNPEDMPHARIRNFHGRMDELAIFDRPLKADEVQRIYRQGKP